MTASGGQWTVPSFALAAGANTIQFANTYTPPTSVPDPTAGGWQLNGSSALSDTGLVLTTATQFQSGSAFWPKAIDPQQHDRRIRSRGRRRHRRRRPRDGDRRPEPRCRRRPRWASKVAGSASPASPASRSPSTSSRTRVRPRTTSSVSATGRRRRAPGVLHWLATANLAAPIQDATNRVKVVTANGNITISVNGLQLIDQPLTLPSSALPRLQRRHRRSRQPPRNLQPARQPRTSAPGRFAEPRRDGESACEKPNRRAPSSSCPAAVRRSFATSALGKGKATPKLTGAVAGAGCTVAESAPAAAGWSATASVNGGAPITLGESEGEFQVPAFALGRRQQRAAHQHLRAAGRYKGGAEERQPRAHP